VVTLLLYTARTGEKLRRCSGPNAALAHGQRDFAAE
jgi:hypothetical protein